MLIGFVRESGAAAALADLGQRDWPPERLVAVGTVAYLWRPGGVVGGPLCTLLDRQLRDGFTTRNRQTLLKLQALARGA